MADAPRGGDTPGPELVRVRFLVRDAEVVLRVAGELDHDAVPTLARELRSAQERVTPPGPLVIDLTEVTFMASAGLSALLDQHRWSRAAGVAQSVVAGNPTIARMFDRTGLTDVLQVRAAPAPDEPDPFTRTGGTADAPTNPE